LLWEKIIEIKVIFVTNIFNWKGLSVWKKVRLATICVYSVVDKTQGQVSLLLCCGLAGNNARDDKRKSLKHNLSIVIKLFEDILPLLYKCLQ
jgi:hypothetical protein